tara:strand:- start:1823 stop:3232 length:1410 start_codon:yes stop_codon:yes gene_type:complete
MLPVIALVGRPNVGKSTLFNKLTRTRDALVADQPGLTRDRQYGLGKIGSSSYITVDTGGISGNKDGIESLMEQQVAAAIDEADLLIFLLDGKDGLTSSDELIASQLRKTGKPIKIAVNKSENLDKDISASDFYSLGLGEPFFIAAAHGRGVKNLINITLEEINLQADNIDHHIGLSDKNDSIRIAVVGRPNVGKSTLINQLLGEERLIVFDSPGTTRDSIYIPFEHNEKKYTLIDTAGVRRRARVRETIEKFSVIKTLQAIQKANVVILVLDAEQGLGEQDATLSGHILDSGRALLVVVNKWDKVNKDKKNQIKEEMDRRLSFLNFADWRYISALKGMGVSGIMKSVEIAFKSAMVDMKTSDINNLLEDVVTEHQPPLVRGRRIKLRYAHQGGKNPPIIIIHGNQTEKIPQTYKRYLINRFRKVFQLQGTPLQIDFKSNDNPYEGKKNKLTKRQLGKRQRLFKFLNRKK